MADKEYDFRVRSMDEYQQLAKRTAGDFGSFENRLIYGASLLAEEAGEVLGKIRKQIYHKYKRDSAVIKDEIGDALWAIAYLAWQLGYTLSEVAGDNIEKLKKRYPDKWVPGGGIRDDSPSLKIVETRKVYDAEDPED